MKCQFLNFQNDFFRHTIHIVDQKLYFRCFYYKTLYVQMWINYNRRKFRIFFEKINKITFSLTSASAHLFINIWNIFLFVLKFEFKFIASANKNANTINIKSKTIKNYSWTKKSFLKELLWFIIIWILSFCLLSLHRIPAKLIEKRSKQ